MNLFFLSAAAPASPEQIDSLRRFKTLSNRFENRRELF
jgi:hypothetical protein